MKPTSLIAGTIATLAAAQEVPDSGLHLASLTVGYAGGCIGAETLKVGLSTSAPTVDYYDMNTPVGRRSAACVMLMDLTAAAPTGWRFSVDKVRHQGHIKLAAGSADVTSDFSLSLTNSHVVNPEDWYEDYKWSINSGSLHVIHQHFTNLIDDKQGTFKQALDWDQDGDIDEGFDIMVPRETSQRSWSPCFSGPDVNRKTQLSLQTFFYFDNTTTAALEGFFGSDKAQAAEKPVLRTTVPLVWERCDATTSPYENWGRHLRVDGPCKQ
ncbi:hypothetical protein PspLS_08156 [Pyricularia sp. CBS 133598]|nr:hypothetical protein PspLS_08156 [Pyricularia sp. CBS 133598]